MNAPRPETKPAAEWVYTGIWQILVKWFRVPQNPPTLPRPADTLESIHSFKPDRGFLQYLKLQFWVALILIDLAILAGWIVLAVVMLPLALVLAVPALLLAIVPDLIAYVAIHLKFDTTWYVISDRSLRIRRGVWTIHETTITFENIQNIKMQQGPLQRFFGISDLIVETAGGGGGTSQSGHSNGSLLAHVGIIEGIANAPEIRQRILARILATKATGLGDESTTGIPKPIPIAELHHSAPCWTLQHLTVLKEIRAAVAPLNRSSAGT